MAHCLEALNSAKSGSAGELDDERAFMISIIHSLRHEMLMRECWQSKWQPRTHVSTIRSALWLDAAETIPHAHLRFTGLNKHTRTFAAQMEAILKYQNGGKQTVSV